MAGRFTRVAQFCRKYCNVATEEAAPVLSKRERVVAYFKNICNDYWYVVKEIGSDSKEYPIRATMYVSATLGLVALWKTNPKEVDFREQLLKNNLELLTIGDPIRNPFADKHMTKLNEYYNAGTIKRFNFGFGSLMWVDNYANGVDLYLARCKPLGVGWLGMKDRVVDIGIMNKWWCIEAAMKDWDVNPEEWGEKDERKHMPGILYEP